MGCGSSSAAAQPSAPPLAHQHASAALPQQQQYQQQIMYASSAQLSPQQWQHPAESLLHPTCTIAHAQSNGAGTGRAVQNQNQNQHQNQFHADNGFDKVMEVNRKVLQQQAELDKIRSDFEKQKSDFRAAGGSSGEQKLSKRARRRLRKTQQQQQQAIDAEVEEEEEEFDPTPQIAAPSARLPPGATFPPSVNDSTVWVDVSTDDAIIFDKADFQTTVRLSEAKKPIPARLYQAQKAAVEAPPLNASNPFQGKEQVELEAGEVAPMPFPQRAFCYPPLGGHAARVRQSSVAKKGVGELKAGLINVLTPFKPYLCRPELESTDFKNQQETFHSYQPRIKYLQSLPLTVPAEAYARASDQKYGGHRLPICFCTDEEEQDFELFLIGKDGRERPVASDSKIYVSHSLGGRNITDPKLRVVRKMDFSIQVRPFYLFLRPTHGSIIIARGSKDRKLSVIMYETIGDPKGTRVTPRVWMPLDGAVLKKHSEKDYCFVTVNSVAGLINTLQDGFNFKPVPSYDLPVDLRVVVFIDICAAHQWSVNGRVDQSMNACIWHAVLDCWSQKRPWSSLLDVGLLVCEIDSIPSQRTLFLSHRWVGRSGVGGPLGMSLSYLSAYCAYVSGFPVTHPYGSSDRPSQPIWLWLDLLSVPQRHDEATQFQGLSDELIVRYHADEWKSLSSDEKQLRRCLNLAYVNWIRFDFGQVAAKCAVFHFTNPMRINFDRAHIAAASGMPWKKEWTNQYSAAIRDWSRGWGLEDGFFIGEPNQNELFALATSNSASAMNDSFTTLQQPCPRFDIRIETAYSQRIWCLAEYLQRLMARGNDQLVPPAAAWQEIVTGTISRTLSSYIGESNILSGVALMDYSRTNQQWRDTARETAEAIYADTLIGDQTESGVVLSYLLSFHGLLTVILPAKATQLKDVPEVVASLYRTVCRHCFGRPIIPAPLRRIINWILACGNAYHKLPLSPEEEKDEEAIDSRQSQSAFSSGYPLRFLLEPTNGFENGQVVSYLPPIVDYLNFISPYLTHGFESLMILDRFVARFVANRAAGQLGDLPLPLNCNPDEVADEIAAFKIPRHLRPCNHALFYLQQWIQYGKCHDMIGDHIDRASYLFKGHIFNTAKEMAAQAEEDGRAESQVFGSQPFRDFAFVPCKVRFDDGTTSYVLCEKQHSGSYVDDFDPPSNMDGLKRPILNDFREHFCPFKQQVRIGMTKFTWTAPVQIAYKWAPTRCSAEKSILANHIPHPSELSCAQYLSDAEWLSACENSCSIAVSKLSAEERKQFQQIHQQASKQLINAMHG